MNMLNGLQILDALSNEDKEQLSHFCQERFLKKGDILFKEGDEGNVLYILKTGAFEVSREIDGEKVLLGTVRAEEMLGEMALFGDTNKRMATATCTKDSILITIISFSIMEMTKKNPELLEKIKEIINDRIISNKVRVEKECN